MAMNRRATEIAMAKLGMGEKTPNGHGAPDGEPPCGCKKCACKECKAKRAKADKVPADGMIADDDDGY